MPQPTEFVPFNRMRERLDRDRDDSDAAYWWSLLYYGELITKSTAAGLVACIGNDPDRLRYSQAHRLVRASGIGDWSQVIDEILVGPPAQFLLPEVQDAARATNQKFASGSWQHEAVARLFEVVRPFDPTTEQPGAKVSLRQWFALFARLRNKTRGHGAPLGGLLSTACPILRESLELVATQHPIYALAWAHLRQSLSGKYKVSYLGAAQGEHFERLKREKSDALAEAIYIDVGRPVRVELLVTDSDLTDFYSPNGDYTPHKYELLSYITGGTLHGDAQQYLASPDDLPSAETEGLGQLDTRGQCFTNLPAPPSGYVGRPQLEHQLREVLLDERRLVVTLHGPGGIGKTSLALHVLSQVCENARFQVVVWFSARDVELLPEGPKPVRPKVLAVKDIATEYASLLAPRQSSEPKFDVLAWLASELEKADAGPTLFVFDNFETVTSPEELFKWLDDRIRSPNKVLITTRLRLFNGDYQVPVAGMDDAESRELIESTATALKIQDVVTELYRTELIAEADGHPYVMKVLLGEVAKSHKLVKIERIVGDREHILAALFERTYERLSPAAKRVFLTIGRWRSIVPLMGLRAIVLRPQNERINVDEALRELEMSSLIDVHVSGTAGHEFVSVPLAAALFAQRKLRADRLKDAIESDVQALRDFGVLQEGDLRHGVGPRVRRLFQAASSRAAKSSAALETDLPVLESVAQCFPDAWLLLADLHLDVGGEDSNQRAQAAVRRLLEHEGLDSHQYCSAWTKLADLTRQVGDATGELQAWAECATASGSLADISLAANKINTVLSQRPASLEREVKHALVVRVLRAFQKYESKADGTTLSRMAWLCWNVGNLDRAAELTRTGLRREPDNDHLANLARKLNLQS
jgi:hypothetical protein